MLHAKIFFITIIQQTKKMLNHFKNIQKDFDLFCTQFKFHEFLQKKEEGNHF